MGHAVVINSEAIAYARTSPDAQSFDGQEYFSLSFIKKW